MFPQRPLYVSLMSNKDITYPTTTCGGPFFFCSQLAPSLQCVRVHCYTWVCFFFPPKRWHKTKQQKKGEVPILPQIAITFVVLPRAVHVHVFFWKNSPPVVVTYTLGGNDAASLQLFSPSAILRGTPQTGSFGCPHQKGAVFVSHGDHSTSMHISLWCVCTWGGPPGWTRKWQLWTEWMGPRVRYGFSSTQLPLRGEVPFFYFPHLGCSPRG